MCGICGILATGPAPEPIDHALMERATDSLAHRGPSDRGTWFGDRIALGSRRLAVLDLSHAGRMPMASADGKVHISYNGEVYNFMELRAEFDLDAKGYRFRSRTDTEVLLYLYQELGTDMVRHLNGMFAISIWDANTNRLHLLRDRYGIKPLFYQQDATHFRFGSEIKAIIEDARVPRRPDLQALHDFLSFDYIPGAQTAFEGIREVPPAHVMTIGADGETRTERYWDLVFEPDPSLTEAGVVARSRELMETAVRRRLIADVPVGVLLSGGMDSSTIAALMARQTKEPIHTYSIGFEDATFNEGAYAKLVSERVGSIHRTVTVTPDLVREMLPAYLRYIDEPYADGSAIPTYYVCGLAKDEVVVVLSGEGGDEAFVGYETYAASRAVRKARLLPRFVRNGLIAPLVRMLPVSHKKLSLEFKLKRFLGGIDLPVPVAHMWWRIVLTEAQKRSLYSSDVLERLDALPPERHFTTAFDRQRVDDDIARLQYIDSTVFLPDDLMIKNDRMSMAHSLEARIPFCDPELTEFMATVPTRIKLKGGRKKHVMVEAMRDLLPEQILGRKKVGLEMPYSRWLREDLRDLTEDYLGADRVTATGLFRAEGIRSLVDEHFAKRADHGRALWGLLNYMMWFDQYL